MHKLFRLFLAGVLFVSVTAACAFAQAPGDEGGYFSGVKNQLMSAVQEQKRLAEENKVLKTELIGLQLEVEELEREILAADPDFFKRQEREGKEKHKVNGWLDPELDALVQEAREIYLGGRFIPLDDLQRLRELQLYDLQFRVQETALDLKSLEFLAGKVDEQRRPEIDALKSSIDGNIAKIREIEMRIMAEEQAARDLPKRVKLLKMENQALLNRIKYLEGLR